MSLSATKSDLITKLRTAMNWTHDIVEEYEAYSTEPCIIVYTEGEGQSQTIGEGIRMWRLVAEMRLPMDGHRDVEFHRDPVNTEGLLGALSNLSFCGALADITSSVGIQESETEAGRAEYLWVECSADMYVSS